MLRSRNHRKRTRILRTGRILIADSHLTPCGYARLPGQPDRERIDVLANEYLPAGTMLKIISQEGIFTKVRKLTEEEFQIWGFEDEGGGL